VLQAERSMRQTIRRLFLLVVVVSASGCFAQKPDPLPEKDFCRAALDEIIEKARKNPGVGALIAQQAGDLTNAQPCMAQLLIKGPLGNELRNARVRAVQKSLQGRLNNQQLGSATAPLGTTGPISKPASSA